MVLGMVAQEKLVHTESKEYSQVSGIQTTNYYPWAMAWQAILVRILLVLPVNYTFFGVLHGILGSPFSSCAIVSCPVCLQQLCNIRNQRIIGIWISEQRTDG